MRSFSLSVWQLLSSALMQPGSQSQYISLKLQLARREVRELLVAKQQLTILPGERLLTGTVH